jgi:anti-sigma regulatory factor (Ser/Thr protein kinase)
MQTERTLRAEPAAVAQARGFLEQTLLAAGVERTRHFDALLVTSELVTNAVSHGSRPGDKIKVKFELDGGRLSILVRDPARARTGPVALSPDEQRPAGRGLSIVDRIADWSEQMSDGHREVSAHLTL